MRYDCNVANRVHANLKFQRKGDRGTSRIGQEEARSTMVAECQAATIQEISQKCQNNTDDPQYHDRR